MAQLPLNEGIERFKQNEERLDLFVNDPVGYTASGGTPVESLRAFLANAQISADIYPTDAEGLAAVSEGQYFSVPSSGPNEYLILYRKVSGAAQEVKRFASIGENSEARVAGDDSDALAVFAATGADGLLYNILAFLRDGTINSPPIVNYLNNRLADVQYESADLAGWGPYVIAQAGPDGNLYALNGVYEDNTPYFPGGGSISGGAAKELYHIPFLGQSNAAADESYPLLSTAPTGWGNWMFTRGIKTWDSSDNPSTPSLRAANQFNFTDLVGRDVETRANGMADHLKSKLVGASRFSGGDQTGWPKVLVSFPGLGGRKLTELGPENDPDSGRTGARPPGGFWPTMLDDIERAKTKSDSLGYKYVVPGWVYDQGESEGELKLYYNGDLLTASATRSGYKTKAVTMIEDFDAQVRSRTGQTRPVPLFVSPPCSGVLIAGAWLDVANEHPLAFMVGPRYMTTSALMSSYMSGGTQRWGDSIHHNSDSHRWIGEQCAKVINRVIREGEDWKPLYAVSARKSGTYTVDVVFNVPRPPLVLDTTWLIKARGWGFVVYSGTVDSQTGRQLATGIEILPDGFTVRLTFATAIPSVNPKLEIGNQSTTDVIQPAVIGLGTGPNTPYGFAQHTITFAGDIRPSIQPLINNGGFYVRSNQRTTQAFMRSVAFDGTNTVLTGEVREIRTGGSFVNIQVGDTVNFGAQFGIVNLRDSDNVLSVYSFSSGPRQGQPYPLHNWCCQYDGLEIIGA